LPYLVLRLVLNEKHAVDVGNGDQALRGLGRVPPRQKLLVRCLSISPCQGDLGRQVAGISRLVVVPAILRDRLQYAFQQFIGWAPGLLRAEAVVAGELRAPVLSHAGGGRLSGEAFAARIRFPPLSIAEIRTW